MRARRIGLGPRKAWTRTILAALLLAGAGPLGATPAGYAATSFSATIAAVDPALPTLDSPITIDVTLANPTTSAMSGIRAQFLLSTSPLRGRSEIPEAVSGRAMPDYRLVSGVVVSGLDLPSGASTTVTLRTSAKALGLSASNPGVYVFGVALSGTSASGRYVSSRPVTLLPWMPERTGGQLGVATVWTLSAPPSRSVDGVFLDDSLAIDILPAGRLRAQLDAMATVPKATWLVDPLLVESVQALAGGARIRQPEGGVRAATDVEMAAAQQWLDDLRTAVATGTLMAMPLGDFDIRGALKFGRITLVRHALQESAARLAAAFGVPTVPLAVPLYGGAVTGSTWRLLDELGAAVAFASDRGYPATQTSYTPTSAMAVPSFSKAVLVFDQVTSTTPIASGLSPVQARQSFAAQLLMTYLERPNDDRAITVAIPPSWVPEAGITSASLLNAEWIQPLGTAEAEAVGTEARRQQQSIASTGQRRQSGLAMGAVNEQRMLRVLTTDAIFSSTVSDLVCSILSRWWTARLDGAAYSSEIESQLASLASSVRVVTRGDIVFGGEKGSVPVTVANGLPVPVDIKLHATGVPAARVQAREFTSVHLNAGKRVSVEVPTQVTGSGDAYLMLQVVATDATSIGEAAFVTVRSAAYARVAGYVVIVAFAALVLLIAANTVRRLRRRRLGLDDDE